MRIAKASHEAVKYACIKFHYARRVPANYSYAYNIYNDSEDWCGCIVFGIGSTVNIARFIGAESGTCLELQRVALNGKQGHNATSRAVSMAMRETKKDAVLLKCLFSYADTGQGHIGTIYQATNWLYLGIRQTGMYEKDGILYHIRTVGDRMKNKPKAGYGGYRYVKSSGKHLYVYPYDLILKESLLARAKPYPKKAA